MTAEAFGFSRIALHVQLMALLFGRVGKVHGAELPLPRGYKDRELERTHIPGDQAPGYKYVPHPAYSPCDGIVLHRGTTRSYVRGGTAAFTSSGKTDPAIRGLKNNTPIKTSAKMAVRIPPSTKMRVSGISTKPPQLRAPQSLSVSQCTHSTEKGEANPFKIEINNIYMI
jgi:hypothetical protein